MEEHSARHEPAPGALRDAYPGGAFRGVVPDFLARAPAPPPPSSPIRVLPREVAERIAAGEVIERPASVVKELLDNALDAGASEVAVELRGGGLELIRVADDGCGIRGDEVELAFARHATSKIRGVDDLAGLATLGFRGEALPSIATVAEVTMLTRTVDEEAATSLVVHGSGVLRRGQAARQRGTTVAVRQLFQNVPARLKFLPAGRAESLAVGALLRRYALARPAVRLSLVIDGHPSFRASGSGDVRTVLGELYGEPVALGALTIAAEAADGRIRGLLTPRTLTRPGRQHVTLVVNGRPAANRAILAALEGAYRPLLPRGRHPIAAIAIDVPPDELDPNVHPAKSEVQLLREAEIAEALAAAVREALGQAPDRPDESRLFALGPTQYALPRPLRRIAERPDSPYDDAPTQFREVLPSLTVLSQAHRSLIVAEGPRGLFLIDQHRAHERVIYEKLRERTEGGPVEAQSLLEPIVLELKPHEAARLEERLAYLEALGFDCQRFGDRDFLVRAVPSLPGTENVALHLQELLEEAAAEDGGWRGRLLTALSCRAAVRRHQKLDEGSMRRLLDELAATAAPATCPHGAPLVLHLHDRFLERQFDW
ncbi:MAG TPA: DNA mismatch repair endonuclease MutL [Chloroflexota bacterium]|nr:DNA mismatch repair endonuclease MutL [Chloroflexota bacterium]